MTHDQSNRRFKVALTADLFGPGGVPQYRDLGLSAFEAAPRIEHRVLDEHRPVLEPDQVGDVQGLIVLTPKVTKATVSRSDDLLAIGRFGVGYDSVDVDACTDADVAVIIAAGAVDHSVAEATVAWMLALTHNIRAKDELVRRGGWDERSRWMGRELRERTLGVVGLGGIGRALVKLLAGFGMNPPLAFDPYIDPVAALELGVGLVGLDELMVASDFVSVNCPLTDQTRGLIGVAELALMKPDAYLINTARGGIVDEDALFDALSDRRIAGAAIDVFAVEPIVGPHRFGTLDNVLLAPHCIAWTDEIFRDIGRTICRAMIDLAHGRRPRGVVNPSVFDRPAFRRKWERLRLAEGPK